MKLAFCRVVVLALAVGFQAIPSAAQDLTPPAPKKMTVHSNILNEDRVVWVRTPRSYDHGNAAFPVLYITDGPGHINEIGSTIDFLVNNNRMPPLIVVGIANTDRTRDLTPTHWNEKDADGKDPNPTSGGGDHFIDFIQKELMPEVEKHYRTSHYRIFAGHSLGGLTAIHILITRPELFQAYIAVSPSLQWDDQHTLHQAQQFFAAQTELNETLFFLRWGTRGNSSIRWGSDLNSAKNRYRACSERFSLGFRAIPRRGSRLHGAPRPLCRTKDNLCRLANAGRSQRRNARRWNFGSGAALSRFIPTVRLRDSDSRDILNNLGYRYLAMKKFDEAIAVFQKNVSLYPGSANVYDSIGEAYETAGKFDLAKENFKKAVEVGTTTSDGNLDQFKNHVKRVEAESKAASEKSSGHK